MNSNVAMQLEGVSLTHRTREGFFRFSKVSALRDVSFDLRHGETLGVIGRNGSGKTTLLRVLGGVFVPDQGRIISDVRSVALMTLTLGFDPALTGRSNALFGGMLLGFSREQVLEHMEEIQEFSGLGGAFDAPVKSYSKGMSARLSFSVAIKMSPDVLLLDEVLSVGDESFRQKAYQAMRNKIQSDQTTVLVSHSASEIERLCDRAILLEAGEVLAEGSPAQVLTEYRALLGRD